MKRISVFIVLIVVLAFAPASYAAEIMDSGLTVFCPERARNITAELKLSCPCGISAVHGTIRYDSDKLEISSAGSEDEDAYFRYDDSPGSTSFIVMNNTSVQEIKLEFIYRPLDISEREYDFSYITSQAIASDGKELSCDDCAFSLVFPEKETTESEERSIEDSAGASSSSEETSVKKKEHSRSSSKNTET